MIFLERGQFTIGDKWRVLQFAPQPATNETDSIAAIRDSDLA